MTAPTNLEYISQQMSKNRNSRGADVLGTPLVTPYWTQGRVLTAQGPIEHVWLKYDLSSNQLLWRRPAGDSLELNTMQVNEFTLGDSLRGSRTTFRRYPLARIEAPELRTSFFEVYYDAGKSALLRQRTKEVGGGTTSPSLTSARPPAWQEKSQYFVKRADNKLMPVRLNEKSVLDGLGSDHASELTAYVKHERLSLKKQEDVVQLLTYYDTL